MLDESQEVKKALDEFHKFFDDKLLFQRFGNNVLGSAVLNIGVAIAVACGVTKEEFLNQMGLVYDESFKRYEEAENEQE